MGAEATAISEHESEADLLTCLGCLAVGMGETTATLFEWAGDPVRGCVLGRLQVLEWREAVIRAVASSFSEVHAAVASYK